MLADCVIECLNKAENGVYLNIHVQPGAAKEGICGFYGNAIKLKVRAQAKEGEANTACLKLLSGLLRLPRTSLEIVSGHQSRSKRIFIKDMKLTEVKELLNV